MTMKPALTAEEWECGGTPMDAGWRFRGDATHFQVEVIRSDGAFGTDVNPSGRHKLAALALYGQPFGFTRKDLDAIDEWIGDIYQIQGEWGVGSLSANDPELLKAQSLRARIEALLPPEG